MRKRSAKLKNQGILSGVHFDLKKYNKKMRLLKKAKEQIK